MIVAIDGPAGAGKSTVARGLAARLGVGYLDTGAMYRALTWLAGERGIGDDDGAALGDMAERSELVLVPGSEGLRVHVDGRDVTGVIRTPGVTARVSAVAAHPQVRRALVGRQRGLLAQGGWVCDGRDIGSVVWPRAEVKVFLTADPEERARRRLADLERAGVVTTLDEVRADVARRDELDSTRRESPLVVAPGAVVLDSSGLDVESVIERLVHLVREAAPA